MNSINYNYIEISSLTIYQYSDEVKVFFLAGIEDAALLLIFLDHGHVDW